MAEIVFPDVSTATAAIFGINAAFSGAQATWPSVEQAYVVEEASPTIAMFKVQNQHDEETKLRMN
jgi:hypothetical protein